MSLPRIPEPSPEDVFADAQAYHEMDHESVNQAFVDDLLDSGKVGVRIIDCGCGPAAIPILLAERLLACPEFIAPPSVGSTASVSDGLDAKRSGEPGGADDLSSSIDSSSLIDLWDWQIMAVDAEVEMLEIAKLEIEVAGLVERIHLQQADLTNMDWFDEGMADTVISNSVIHHLDDTAKGFAELVRLTQVGGRLFVRDLARPDSTEQIEALVETHSVGESDYAKQLLRQSLHAALTLREVQGIVQEFGIPADCVEMTSDRHWTLQWTRPSIDA